MSRLEEYEVEVRPGVTLTMKLDAETAEKADKNRVRPTRKQPQNKAAVPRTKQG